MTRLRLADRVVHQQQPTPVCCTATCVAMAVGLPVADLGVDLSRPYDQGDFGLWLAERGIWLRVARCGEPLRDGRLYLVRAGSPP